MFLKRFYFKDGSQAKHVMFAHCVTTEINVFKKSNFDTLQ